MHPRGPTVNKQDKYSLLDGDQQHKEKSRKQATTCKEGSRIRIEESEKVTLRKGYREGKGGVSLQAERLERGRQRQMHTGREAPRSGL